MPRRLIVPLIAAFALVPAASAHAGWFPAAPLDGPNAEVVSVGGVDLARDGTGAVGYLRMADGVPHAHVARLSGGVWGGPERIDFVAAEATEVKVAAGDGNRLAVAWIAGGTVYATVSPGGATPAGFVPPVAVGGPGAEDIDIDLGVNGAAYVVWQQAGNVHAARLQDSTWATRRGAAGHRPRPRGGHRAAAPARGGLGRGLRRRHLGRASRRRLDARVGPPDHRHEPVGGAAGPHAARRLRRLAGHRHRGRRVVRLDRVPAADRRRPAHAGPAARSARSTRRPSSSTAATPPGSRPST